MSFTQMITVQASSADALIALLSDWDDDQKGVAPGYERSRLLADKDNPDRYVIEVDFSDEDRAQENNNRPETQAWAEKLQAAADGEPQYHNYEAAYHTA